MDQLINLPWWLKLVLAMGGASMIWNAINMGIPKAGLWLKSWVVQATAKACKWALGHPAVAQAVVAHKDRLLPILRAIKAVLVEIIEAAEEEVEGEIAEASKASPEGSGTAPAPAQEPGK